MQAPKRGRIRRKRMLLPGEHHGEDHSKHGREAVEAGSAGGALSPIIEAAIDSRDGLLRFKLDSEAEKNLSAIEISKEEQRVLAKDSCTMNRALGGLPF